MLSYSISSHLISSHLILSYGTCEILASVYHFLLYLFLTLLSSNPGIRPRIFIFDFSFNSCQADLSEVRCYSNSTSFALCFSLIRVSIATITTFSSTKGPLSRPIVLGWLSVANYFLLCRLKNFFQGVNRLIAGNRQPAPTHDLRDNKKRVLAQTTTFLPLFLGAPTPSM